MVYTIGANGKKAHAYSVFSRRLLTQGISFIPVKEI